jgi:Histidine kinase-, DNA gyrase B-, and HSP90-like ATPase
MGEEPPQIEGDRVQLQQVMLNLISNAVQAMSCDTVGESKKLVICTGKAKPNGISVTVSDSGPGLDSVNLERVFEAFYTTKPDGLGKGLYRSAVRSSRLMGVRFKTVIFPHLKVKGLSILLSTLKTTLYVSVGHYCMRQPMHLRVS